jgi:ABC-type transport system substrate-binding protein
MQTLIYYDLHQMGAPMWGDGNLVQRCLNDAYVVCPSLAESWEQSKDFTEFTFKIRSGVRWHDGTPFTVDDAKFWVDLAYYETKGGEKTRKPAWYKADFGEVKKVEVLEGSRLRITLARPNPGFLLTLAAPYYTLAHPRHLTQPRIEKGEVGVTPLDMGLVGTGPFKFLKYEKGVRFQIRRFDGYWEKDAAGRQLPYMEGMDFAIMPSPQAMDAALRVGRLDGGSPGGGFILSKERHAAYVKDLGDKVWFAEIPSASGINTSFSFNLLKPGKPWQDVRVRRALNLWIDKQASIDAVTGGFGFLTPLLNPQSPYTTPDFMKWPGWNPATREQDKAEAKRLMAEAGYPRGGFLMTYNCQTLRVWQDRCEFLQAQVGGLGIELKLDLLETAQWTATGLSLDYDSYQVGSVVSTPLPEATELVLSTYSVTKSAFTKHEDLKVPEYYRRLSATLSFDERVKIWREFEKYYLLDQVYLIPLAQSYAVIPYWAHVKGRVVPTEGIMNNMDFATVWLDK